jgi:hypothetical protein
MLITLPVAIILPLQAIARWTGLLPKFSVSLNFGVKVMNQIVKDSWSGDPPRIKVIVQPLPSAPFVYLSGGGSADMSLDSYINDLKRDIRNQTGNYFAYVVKSNGGSREEADTFTLQTWEVYTSSDSCYEALVILYYAPINEYLCLKKHKGEAVAQEYLDKIQAREVAIAALAEALT